MSYKLLSIDPSLSSTGYSVIDSDTREIYDEGRYTTKPSIEENDRIRNIVMKLYGVCIQYDIEEIAMEDGFISSINIKTGIQLAKLRGGLITYFMVKNIPIHTQLPSETRKNLGLKGNAKKEDVANKIIELYPGIISKIGPYSDKTNKQKTSDIYDSICIGNAHLNKKQGLVK